MSIARRLQALVTGRGRESLVAVAALVLVIAIGWTLAAFGWLLVDGVPAAGPTDDMQPAPATVSVLRSLTPDMARGWTLFGDAAPPVDTGQPQDAPQTSLALQLLGIFSTGDARLAGAVIAERGKAGELFRAGAALPGGATLEKVEKDRVLLRRRGQLETLRFDVQAATISGADAENESPPEESDDEGLPARSLRAGVPDNSGEQRDMASRFIEDFRASPDIVLNDVGLSPASGGGYSVGAGANADLLRKLGLRPGDVVLSVNGKTIGNAQADAGLVEEVKASGVARVEIRRGSQTFTVNYPL